MLWGGQKKKFKNNLFNQSYCILFILDVFVGVFILLLRISK